MRPLPLGFALLLLVGAVAPTTTPAGVTTSAGAAGLSPSGETAAYGDSDRPRTTLRIQLADNGSARWTVVTRYRLSSENETTAFRALVERLRSDETDADLGPETFRRFAAKASNATGRPMNITGVNYRGNVANETGTGTLTLSFRWTNFADTSDGYRVSDAFDTPDGEGETWFPALGADQRLVVYPPPSYDIRRERGLDTNGSALYVQGPKRFGSNSPMLVYERTGIDDSSPSWALVGGALVLLVAAALAAAVAFYLRNDGSVGDGAFPGGALLAAAFGSDDEERRDGSATEDRGAASAPATDADTGAAERSAVATPTDGGEDGAATAEDDGIDPSLLSDEERVERIVERNGGRMRQADIVTETDWSDAKVSQLLSRMADEGRVDKLRLGRENLISLPDRDDGD